jgi:hypothetical protein
MPKGCMDKNRKIGSNKNYIFGREDWLITTGNDFLITDAKGLYHHTMFVGKGSICLFSNNV